MYYINILFNATRGMHVSFSCWLDCVINLEYPFAYHANFCLVACRTSYVEHVLCMSIPYPLSVLATSTSWYDAKPSRNAQRALWCSTWSVCWSATLLSFSCCSGETGRLNCLFFVFHC
jgi:hypothetical protein